MLEFASSLLLSTQCHGMSSDQCCFSDSVKHAGSVFFKDKSKPMSGWIGVSKTLSIKYSCSPLVEF